MQYFKLIFLLYHLSSDLKSSLSAVLFRVFFNLLKVHSFNHTLGYVCHCRLQVELPPMGQVDIKMFQRARTRIDLRLCRGSIVFWVYQADKEMFLLDVFPSERGRGAAPAVQGGAVPVQQQALHPGALAMRRGRRLPGRQRRALRDLLYVCTSLCALNPCLTSVPSCNCMSLRATCASGGPVHSANKELTIKARRWGPVWKSEGNLMLALVSWVQP